MSFASLVDALTQFIMTNSALVSAVMACAILVLTLLLIRHWLQEQKHHQSLLRTRDHLRWSLWGSGDGLWDWDLKSARLYRTGVPEMLGYPTEQFENNMNQLLALIHPADLPQIYIQLGHHLCGDSEYFEAEYRLKSANGSYRWMLDRGKIVERDAKGTPIRIAGTQKDITDRKENEQKLALSSEVIQCMNEVVMIVDEQFRVVRVNEAFHRVMAYPAVTVLRQPVELFQSPRQSREFYNSMRVSLETQGQWRGEVWQKTARGDSILTWMESKRVAGTEGYYVSVFTDITAKKAAEEELRYLANFDALTGLPNRSYFLKRLSQSLREQRQTQQELALVFLDLDRFKQINDTLGHAAGDQLLTEVAVRLKGAIINSKLVARLSGDEFTLLVEGNLGQVTEAAMSVLQAFESPFNLLGREVLITPSMGISRAPNDANDSSTLLKLADTAMYHAKAKGRGNFQFYNEAMQVRVERRAHIESALRRALNDAELALHYQPKFALPDNTLIGCEALLRFEHPNFLDATTEEIITIAEDTGLIVPLGSWLLRQVAGQIALWHSQGIYLRVAINLSARQLHRTKLLAEIDSCLATNQITANYLEVELTETALMEDPGKTADILRGLKKRGITISVDDFGTGYSSLAYLKRFPIDTLKIDKMFIRDLADDIEVQELTRTIIGLGHNLGLTVIAEGVEQEKARTCLIRMDCDQVQGFLTGRPLPADEFFRVFCTQKDSEQSERGCSEKNVL